MRIKQIGVSLPPATKEKLLRMAKEKRYTVSGMAAYAITYYLNEHADELEQHTVSIFTGLRKRESIRQIQKSS